MLDPALFYWIMIPLTLVGGAIRGFAGFGSPLIMLPILNLFLPPVASAWIFMWVDISSNIQLLPEARKESSRAVVMPLAIGSLITMPIGLYLLVTTDPQWMKQVVSATILIAALILLSGWRYRGPLSTKIYGAVGALSGFVFGAVSLGIVAPLFLTASTHTAKENRANFNVWVIFGSVLLLTFLTLRGNFGMDEIVKIAVLAPAYHLGIAMGSRWQRGAADRVVRRYVILLIIAVAIGGLLI